VFDGQLLVLPIQPKADLTKSLQRSWRFYGTLDSRSTLFDGVAIELHLQGKGFVVVDTKPSLAPGAPNSNRESREPVIGTV
jgi:hypothetical protein